MDSTTAVRPLRAMSMMSACFRGWIRTRSPTVSDHRSHFANRAVHAHEVFAGERLGAIEQRAGSRVGGAHFGFFIVRQRENSQAQDLIDLGGVKQIAGGFRSNLGMILEDDRRREHSVRCAWFPDENRPEADVPTCRGGVDR